MHLLIQLFASSHHFKSEKELVLAIIEYTHQAFYKRIFESLKSADDPRTRNSGYFTMRTLQCDVDTTLSATDPSKNSL
jgi:hypothetical protein